MVVNIMNDILELGMLILIFIGILLLTYFVTRQMAGFNKHMMYNKNMKIVEVVQLTQGQYLYLVKIGEEIHLIGSAQKGNISYCTKIEDLNLKFEEKPEMNFANQLSYFMKGNKRDETKDE